jgi:uncharacterized protein (TIGR03435 family)
MNLIHVLSSQPWVERLGWTLVHFLWQGLSIALLYEAARRGVTRKWTPNARYLFACVALAAMSASPLVTWVVMQPSNANLVTAYRIRTAPPAASNTRIAPTISLPTSVRATVSGVQQAQLLVWVVMVWLVGSLVFCVRLAGGLVIAARMRSVSVRQAPPEWQEILKKLATRIGVSRPVRLLVSALAQVPTVIGWLRPVVLVPVGALSGLPAEHLEPLLLHELAHIRRHDYLVNILQSLAEALLFYHPAVWWVSGHIRAERELCCDDVAVAVSGDALTYARALAQWESLRPAHLNPAVATNGGSLSDRIARLLGQPRPGVRTGLGPGVLAVALLLMAAAYGLFGQSAARPAFQSVSIKRNTSNWSERFRHGMGMNTNASLLLLIQFAYANHDPMLGHFSPLPASQVVGGPAWLNSEGYDIEVKPGANADPKLWWQMWQTLLADRFKLKLHRETRELPVYVLTAAKSGFKLPAAKQADCVSFPPGTKPHHVPGKVDCGYVSGPAFGLAEENSLAYPAGLGLGMVGRKIRIADLSRQLALILDRPILDKTGFTGEFDLFLNFTSDGALMGMPPGYGGPANPDLPNIFAALEEQLGLKLAPAKSPVEVLVIDHAEQPTVSVRAPFETRDQTALVRP